MKIRNYIGLSVIFTAIVSGCGIDFHIGNGGGPVTPPQKLALAANTANDVAAMSNDLNRLVQFSQGVEGIAPNLADFFAAAGQGGWLGTAAKSSGGLALAASNDRCPLQGNGNLPTDNICYISATRQRPEAGVENANWTFVLYFPHGDTSEVYVVDAYGKRTFSDGSTSDVAIKDLEAKNGTTAANLNRHDIEIQEFRYYRAGSRMLRQEGRIGANFRGTADDSSAEDRRRVNDQSDQVFYAKLLQFFGDGSSIRVEYWPSERIERDQQPTAGAITRESTYVKGPLRYALETLTFDGETATGGKLLRYSDNSEERETYSLSATEVRIDIQGRRGESVAIVIDRVNNQYSKVAHFTADHPVERSEETGQYQRSGTGRLDINLTAVTHLRNGQQETLEATVAVDTNRRAEVVYNKQTSAGSETGNLVLVFGLSSISIEAQITLANSIVVALEGVVYAGGYATLSVAADDPATAVNPDWQGEFRVYSDGSAEGEVVVDGVTYIVTRNSNGQVSQTPKT